MLRSEISSSKKRKECIGFQIAYVYFYSFFDVIIEVEEVLNA